MKPFRILLLLASLSVSRFASGQVTTYHYNNSRTGVTTGETVLTTSNVNTASFGKLFSMYVDAEIYAQPLYVPTVTIPQQGVHNVLYVATENNSVYAFDANYGKPLWQVNLGPPMLYTTCCTAGGTTRDMFPQIGITSTPVIDPVAGILYVVAESYENGVTFFRLHALNVGTGQDVLTPAVIQGSVPGSSSDSSNGTLTFSPISQWQRPALLLVNGNIYVGFGSHQDTEPYHGWLFAYSATTLQQTGILCFAPGGQGNGLWQGGVGLSADTTGNIYIETGNGPFDINTGGTDYGDSILKIGTSSSGLTVLDYFSPSTQLSDNLNDWDLGSSGPLLIPGTSLGVAGGKDGMLYVFSTGNLGGYHSVDQIYQEWQATFDCCSPPGGFWGGNYIFYNSTLYAFGERDWLKTFAFNGSQFTTTTSSQSPFQVPAEGISNDPAMSISASGFLAGTGIVWTAFSSDGIADGSIQPGVFYAFDASNVSSVLWSSNQNSSRDYSGSWAKWCPPIVVNGKVYLASFDNLLNVYGLLNAGWQITATAGTPQSATVNTAFATALQASVKDANGNPVSGVTVTFTAPATGASAAFGGAGTATAVTNGSGIATAPVLTANGTAGSYAVTASAAGVSGTASYSLTNVAGTGGGGGWAINNSSQSSAAGNPGGTTYSASPFANPLHNPSIILVGVLNIPNNPITVSDTAGNTYSDAGSGLTGGYSNRFYIQVFCAYNTSSISSNVVKMTSTSFNYPRLLAVEITGAPSSSTSCANAIDAVKANANATSSVGSNNVTTTAVTTTANGDFIFGWFGIQNGAPSAGTSPNIFAALPSPANELGEYFVQTSGGSIAATATDNASSDPYAALFVALRGLAGNATSITATAGTPQSATVNTAFATALQASVKDANGNPVSGVTVTFTAPATGASAAFGGAGTATAVTNGSGIATAPVLTANGTAGSYAVTASAAGVSGTASYSLTNVAGTGGGGGWAINNSSQSSAAGNPGGTTYSASPFANPLHNPSIILVGVLNIPNNPITVSDTAGNTYSDAGSGLTGGYSNRFYIQVFCAYNTSSISSNVVKMTSTSFNYPRLLAVEITGAPSSSTSCANAIDAVKANANATSSVGSNNVTTTAVTTTANGDFIFGWFGIQNGAPSAGTSPNIFAALPSPANELGEYFVQTSGGSIAATATDNASSDPYAALFVALRGLAGNATSITATAGTPQSATVNTAFATALQASVKDANGNPVSGVTVTFTAPATGASAAFGGAGTATAVTNGSGIATAPVLTANGTAGSYAVTASAAGAGTAASFNLTNLAGSATSITATAGTPQSATVNTAFATALQASVEDANGNPVSGVTVTFTAPATGASAAFGGAGTATAVTNGSGIATAPVLTANGTAGSYAVTASAAGVSGTASYSLTNVAGTGGGGGWAINNSSQSSAAGNPGGTTYSASPFANPLHNPSIILVGVLNIPNNPITVSDTAGNTYSDAGSGLTGGYSNRFYIQVFCAYNTSSISSNVVKMTSTSFNYPRLLAVEITGAPSSSTSCANAIDAVKANANATSSVGSNNVTTTAVTTTANGDFIFGWFGIQNGAPSAGTSPNIFAALPSPANELGEYFVQTSGGSIAATATDNASSDPYAALFVALRGGN